jgi:molybdopterin molybdotransferase
MDGYAARAADVLGASRDRPRVLHVVETIPAGTFPTRALGPGECARIFTGAPLPEGADSVIRQEDTAPVPAAQGSSPVATPAVSILSDRDAGLNIRRAGEDIRKGEHVLEPGTELGPAHLGVLASLAVAHPLVHRRPRVAILASGDEIADLDQADEILGGRKIASSNTHTLLALIQRAGGIPVNLGIAADTVESLRDHLRRGQDCDLLVTTAGISVGEHDHLRAAIEAEGGEIRFWKLRMRPGAPVAYGRVYGLPWIGLPGNPVSTMVTFELFVRPAIRRMLGHRFPFRATTRVRVGERIVLKPRLQHFLRAAVAEEEGQAVPAARLAGPQGSGILTSMVRANALLIIPEGQHETPEGALADALLFDQTRHVADPPW